MGKHRVFFFTLYIGIWFVFLIVNVCYHDDWLMMALSNVNNTTDLPSSSSFSLFLASPFFSLWPCHGSLQLLSRLWRRSMRPSLPELHVWLRGASRPVIVWTAPVCDHITGKCKCADGYIGERWVLVEQDDIRHRIFQVVYSFVFVECVSNTFVANPYIHMNHGRWICGK